jgi:hypothetical protein
LPKVVRNVLAYSGADTSPNRRADTHPDGRANGIAHN